MLDANVDWWHERATDQVVVRAAVSTVDYQDEQWDVKHPDNLAIGKHFMILIEPETDRTHDLYLLHVVAFERQPKAAA